MDAAEVWLKILQTSPYVALAGLVGAGAIAARHRGFRLHGSSPGAGSHMLRAWRDSRAGEWLDSRLRAVRGPAASWPAGGAPSPAPAVLREASALHSQELAPRFVWTPARAGAACAVLAALVAVPSALYWGDRDSEPAALPPGSAAEPAPPVPLPTAEADGALKFGAASAMALPVPGVSDKAADTAWLFGALLSGGRMAEAHALLSSEARQFTPLAEFSAGFRKLRLLRGSDDAPWRVPGSDVFLFNLTEDAGADIVKGELRIGLERQAGQWRVVTLRHWSSAQQAAASRP